MSYISVFNVLGPLEEHFNVMANPREFNHRNLIEFLHGLFRLINGFPSFSSHPSALGGDRPINYLRRFLLRNDESIRSDFAADNRGALAESDFDLHKLRALGGKGCIYNTSEIRIQ